MNDPQLRASAATQDEISPTSYLAWGAFAILAIILLCSGGVWLLGRNTTPAAAPTLNRAQIGLATPLQANQPVTLQGSGFQPGERVEIFVSSAPDVPFASLNKLAEAVADGNGNVTIGNVPAPANPTGTLFLVARGSGSGFTQFAATTGTQTTPPPAAASPAPGATPSALPVQGAVNLPDLAIGSVSIEPQTPVACTVNNTPPQQGIKVDIRNTTPFAAGPFVVVVNNAQYTRNEGLEGGRSLVLWFPGYQTGINKITVDSANQVKELSENNNVIELPLAVPTALPNCPAGPNPQPTQPPPASGPTVTPDPNAVNIWYAEYFANQEIFPPATIRRYEPGAPNLNLDWRGGSPGAGIPPDGFSGVLTRIQEFPSTDNYVFDFTVDDGGRVYIDGVLLIDEWRNGPARTVQAARSLTKGPHTIRIEFYESSGGARVGLSWKSNYANWRGRYYNNPERSGVPVLVRDDRDELGGPGLNFDWGFGSPAAEVNIDGFSVDWQRTLNFQAGTYVFTADVDDGVRIYIDGAPIIDNYATSGSRVVTATRVLNAGPHSIQVQYVEYSGQARFQLSWERQLPPSTATAPPPPTPVTPSATPIPVPTATQPPTAVVVPSNTPIIAPTDTVPPPPPPPPSVTPTAVVLIITAAAP